MSSHATAVVLLVCGFLSVHGFSIHHGSRSARDPDGKQAWGYVEVRPGAHSFYWLYYTTADQNYTSRPLVMWLQGGPGASSTGYGNFYEIGPVDVNLNPRQHPWTDHANILFVDNPVGTGFSYVDDPSLLATNNKQIGIDLTALMKGFLDEHPEFQSVPFYAFSESYGGKMVVDFGIELDKEIKAGNIKSNFKGVVLGDPWVSPIDSVLTWGPFLFETAYVDSVGLGEIEKSAEQTRRAVEAGQWTLATTLWAITENVILDVANGVNFYNIQAQENIYGWASLDLEAQKRLPPLEAAYRRHVSAFQGQSLSQVMNGVVRTKFGSVIPPNITWGGQSSRVFSTLAGDFMKPAIDEVDILLNSTSLKVAVVTGQLDLIVDTPGTVKWAEKLNWNELKRWHRAERRVKSVKGELTSAFYKEHGNFSFYWIMRAGHMVPIDTPEVGIWMLRRIIDLD